MLLRCYLGAVFGAMLTAQSTPPAPQTPIGAKVDAEFTDLRWQSRRLAELRGHAAIVVYFATVECPMVQRYLQRLGDLAHDYEARGVVTIVANVGAGDSFVDAAGQVVEQAPAAIFAKDSEHALARACGVDRSGAAVVLDRDLCLRYRGRIDDQHGYANSRDRASRHDLQSAVDEVLAGQQVTIPETAVTGCKLTLPGIGTGAVPTYAQHIAPILSRRCAMCHVRDGKGQFSLTLEADAKKHGAMIAEVVANGRMPPWSASSQPGRFANSLDLSLPEREAFRQWFHGGMPTGDLASMPAPRHPIAPAWSIQIDEVLGADEPVTVPASGTLPYQYLALPRRFAQDTWIEAIEVLSAAGRAFQHANLAVVPAGAAYDPRGFLHNHVAHGPPLVCDTGTAVRIPKDSQLVLQAYYVPTGRPALDRLQVGIRFPRAVVAKELRVTTLVADDLEVPAGARSHPVTLSTAMPADGVARFVFVHLRQRGRDVRVIAAPPAAAPLTLLLVPSYNFAGQQSYHWQRSGKPLPRGTTISAVAHFDNSAWNSFNPDPTAVARNGPGVADEAACVSLAWVPRDESLGIAIDPSSGTKAVAQPAGASGR